MRNSSSYLSILVILIVAISDSSFAQNPIIQDQFTADPAARVFRESVPSGESRVHVYPSHDIPCSVGQGIIGFCMPDYHVFFSKSY